MRVFLATVLSVIAIGVMLIAYGLLNPRTAADPYAYPGARPVVASPRVGVVDEGDASRGYAPNPYLTDRPTLVYPVNNPRPIPAYETYPARRPVTTRRVVTRTSSRVATAPRRDWVKTAMVIGATTASGAGLGGIFGGRKGALIGAALGGGAGTLYEVSKR
jgi:hypothetical protein